MIVNTGMFDFQLYRMKLFIRNMVSLRCKLLVKDELTRLGLHPTHIELGEVEISEQISDDERAALDGALRRSGLELMDDKRAILIERIKHVVIETIHYSDQALRVNFSDHLAEKLQHNYTYLANIFSESTGTTIEHFIIHHKIERVKELIVYGDLTLTEIAYKMHYSSVAHLSNQFKKVTGLTPTFFKRLKERRLSGIDGVDESQEISQQSPLGPAVAHDV